MMATTTYDLDNEAGCLIFQWTGRPDTRPTHPIMPDDEFDIGRVHFRRAFDIDELTISNHHLKFRCVVFNDGTEEQIAPMVYVRVLSSNPVQLTRRNPRHDAKVTTIRNTNEDVLLDHGDIVSLTTRLSLTFSTRNPTDPRLRGLDPIQTAEAQCFGEQFTVSDRKLGTGAQANVFFAAKQSTGQLVACKVIPQPYTQRSKSKRIWRDVSLTKLERDAELKKIEHELVQKQHALTREFSILKDLDHPNVIRLEKVICGSYNLYIFQELITGGDLMSYMDHKGPLSEPQSAVIIYQLLKAVEYLHSNGVVHRDIKPENILLTTKQDGARIVLTDFDHSKTLKDAAAIKSKAFVRMQTQVGTIGYAAPEIFKEVRQSLHQEGYREVVDIWSVGCIAAALLSGGILFPDEMSQHENFSMSNNSTELKDPWDTSIMEHGQHWANVKSLPKSFIRDCVVVDEDQRMTAQEALLHPWLSNKHYATVLEKVYQRAITDWKPRHKSQDLVQFIDTTNIVPKSTRPEHVKRLVDEVKSRHFQSLPIAPSIMSLLKQPPARITQHKRKRTSLPQIADDASEGSVEVPASPSVTQLRHVLENPLRAPYFTQPPYVRRKDSAVQLSVEDFAPPRTQRASYTPHTCLPPNFEDSQTQSQMLLEEHSIPNSMEGYEDQW